MDEQKYVELWTIRQYYINAVYCYDEISGTLTSFCVMRPETETDMATLVDNTIFFLQAVTLNKNVNYRIESALFGDIKTQVSISFAQLFPKGFCCGEQRLRLYETM